MENVVSVIAFFAGLSIFFVILGNLKG